MWSREPWRLKPNTTSVSCVLVICSRLLASLASLVPKPLLGRTEPFMRAETELDAVSKAGQRQDQNLGLVGPPAVTCPQHLDVEVIVGWSWVTRPYLQRTRAAQGSFILPVRSHLIPLTALEARNEPCQRPEKLNTCLRSHSQGAAGRSLELSWSGSILE